jgi:predicted transcriptional regulator
VAEQLRPKKSAARGKTAATPRIQIPEDLEVAPRPLAMDGAASHQQPESIPPGGPRGFVPVAPVIRDEPGLPDEIDDDMVEDDDDDLPQAAPAGLEPLSDLQSHWLEEYEDLGELDRAILSIAENVLKLKRYDPNLEAGRLEFMPPLLEALVAKCLARLRYSMDVTEQEIFDRIKALEDQRWLVTGQRRTKKEVLENPTIMRVLQFIQDHPGTHARDPLIVEELGISRNPFTKHVMVLASFDLVRIRRLGRTSNYFPMGLTDNYDELLVLFSNDLIPKILQGFMDDPEAGVTHIARECGVHHGAIQYHIKTLAEMNLVDPEDQGGRTRYQVNVPLLKQYRELFDIPPFTFPVNA